MIIDIFLILIIFFSFYFIIRILVSKFPIISNIKIEQIYKEKQKNTKSRILEKKFLEKIEKFLPPACLKNFCFNFITTIKTKIKNIEEKYLKKYGELIRERPAEIEKIIENNIQKGVKNIREEKFQEAEKIFLEIIGLDPRNLIAFKNLFKIYLSQKKKYRAKEIAKQILKLNQQDLKWWLKFKKKKEEMPEKVVNELVLSLINLGEIYSQENRNLKAISFFKKAFDYNSNNPRLLDFLIENYIILGKKGDALFYLDKIKKINPDNQKIIEWQKILGP